MTQFVKYEQICCIENSIIIVNASEYMNIYYWNTRFARSLESIKQTTLTSRITFRILRRTPVQTLLKQVTSTFQLGSSVTFEELGQISVPDIVYVRPLEQSYALFVSLECLFEIVVLLEEHGVVHDDLRSGDAEVEDPVVAGLARFKRTEAFFEVGVQGPNLQGKVDKTSRVNVRNP